MRSKDQEDWRLKRCWRKASNCPATSASKAASSCGPLRKRNANAVSDVTASTTATLYSIVLLKSPAGIASFCHWIIPTAPHCRANTEPSSSGPLSEVAGRK